MLEKFKKISENDRIILKNVIGAFGVKGLSLIVSMLTLPVYMDFFSDQQVLGVWYTVLSVLTWILNFDLGVGNGLRNHLTVALNKNDKTRAKQLVSSAYVMVGAIVLLIGVLLFSVIDFVDWNEFFNIKNELVSEKDMLVVVQCALIGILLQFFLRLISSILYALQYSAVNNAISLIISVLYLLVALLAPRNGAIQSLRLFSVAHIFCTNIPLIIATVVVFMRKLPYCRPSIRYFEKEAAKSVISLGGIFFLCQILYMCIANTNEFFITQYFDPGYVVEYQIYHKIFTLGSMIMMLALTPVWSAVSKAVAENNYVWLKKLYNMLGKMTIIAVMIEFSLIFGIQLLVNLWLGENAIAINYIYAFVFALFGATMMCQAVVSTFTNGMGHMKIQTICYGVGVCFKFVFVHMLSPVYHEWIIVVFSNALVLIPYCLWQHIDMRRLLNKNIASANGKCTN